MRKTLISIKEKHKCMHNAAGGNGALSWGLKESILGMFLWEGVVRYIEKDGANMKDFPGFSSSVSSLSVPPWKKSSLVLIKPSRKIKVKKFCAIDSVQSGLCHHLTTLVCIPGCTPVGCAQAHAWSLCICGPAWLLGQRTHKQAGECVLPRDGGGGGELFVRLIILS